VGEGPDGGGLRGPEAGEADLVGGCKAAQIMTTGLTVATALTAKATIRVRAPESTWSEFAAASRCPFCRAVGGARPRLRVGAGMPILEQPPAPHFATTLP
jgi:hypothetical protein